MNGSTRKALESRAESLRDYIERLGRHREDAQAEVDRFDAEIADCTAEMTEIEHDLSLASLVDGYAANLFKPIEPIEFTPLEPIPSWTACACAGNCNCLRGNGGTVTVHMHATPWPNVQIGDTDPAGQS